MNLSMQSDDAQYREKDEPQRPNPQKQQLVPSLALLCRKVIASKIERYSPECLAILSEYEWESVVRLRHQRTTTRITAGTNTCRSRGGLDGAGRITPAISDKVMRAIEDANPHLQHSTVADQLVWKDCVEYKFKSGGQSRPLALQYPWPVLVERLTKAGNDLVDLLQPPPPNKKPRSNSDGGDDDRTKPGSLPTDDSSISVCREKTLEKCFQTLSNAPMSVPLLTATGVGMQVQKFVKKCYKIKPDEKDINECNIPPYFVDVWSQKELQHNPTPLTASLTHTKLEWSASPFFQLERLIKGWKEVASATGVVVSKASSVGKGRTDLSICLDEFTGRDKKTSEEQHALDMKTLQKCQQWRDLHSALLDREAKMTANHGARMRQIREDLEMNRPKITKVTVKTTKTIQRQEAILNGSRGTRALEAAYSASCSSSPSVAASKLQQLRRQTAVGSAWLKSSVETKKSVTMGSSSTSTARGNIKISPAAAAARPSFGESVAIHYVKPNLSGKRKDATPGVLRKGEVMLGNGKKIKLPPKKNVALQGDGVFSSLQKKKQIESHAKKPASRR